VLAWWVYEDNTDAQLFAHFITEMLIPDIRGEPCMTVLCDNLASHFTGNVVENALVAAGHRLIARPSYSPDFAPIESAFSKVKYWLRRFNDDITAANFSDAIEMAVLSITAQDVQGWFAGCHYCVPGRPFKPYMGMSE
jgi:serine/threonine protein phosphatase PrpC